MTIARVSAGAVLVLASAVVLGCDKEPPKEVRADKAGQPSQRGTTVEELAPPAPPPRETPRDLIQKVQSFSAAVEMVKPDMADTHDEHSGGTLLLTVWAASHLRWEDVGVTKNETSFALVKKDSDEARGKRMCASGTLIQISKQDFGDLGGNKIYGGLLLTRSGDILSFFAAGSTGSLVERNKARFCGVVTGTYDYSNSAGGVGHAVATVGMFDLPENNGAK